MREPTYCIACAHVYKEGKNDPPWRWMCVKHPRGDGFGYVTPGTWDNAPPYLFCKDVNSGCCPLYEAAAPGQMKIPMEANSG